MVMAHILLRNSPSAVPWAALQQACLSNGSKCLHLWLHASSSVSRSLRQTQAGYVSKMLDAEPCLDVP